MHKPYSSTGSYAISKAHLVILVPKQKTPFYRYLTVSQIIAHNFPQALYSTNGFSDILINFSLVVTIGLEKYMIMLQNSVLVNIFLVFMTIFMTVQHVPHPPQS